MSSFDSGIPGRQHASALWLDRLEGPETAIVLEAFGIAAGSRTHSEAWLQDLFFRFPQVLPVAEIEPAFGDLFPVCTELPTPAGYADNLFVTGNGNLVIVECKLWRNPEARREVVAQIIDYAHGMAGWSYEDLERAVRQAGAPAGCQPPTALYDVFGAAAKLDEADFVDAVARNLRLGRILLLLVGDGIREGVESLSGWLQAHAGFHFTLGMVEMPIFPLPTGGFVMQPRIVARTINIERGIVRIADGKIAVEATPAAFSSNAARKRTSISQDTLLEMVAKVEPGLPSALSYFLERAEVLGTFLDSASSSLQVRWRSPCGVRFALAGISKEGELWTNNINFTPEELGHVDLAHDYIQKLALLLSCDVNKVSEWYLTLPGIKKLPKAMALLQRPDEWLALLADYTCALERALAARSAA